MINASEIQTLPPDELYRRAFSIVPESTKRAFMDFRAKQGCISKALEKPLPGAAADAFLNGSLKVDGRTIYEVMPAHIKGLQALESPLLRMGQKAASDGKSDEDLTEEQQWELCHLFTISPKELRLTLKNNGAAKLKADAEAIWENVNAAQINVTCIAILNQYARHFQTTVKFAEEMEASGDTHFFQELREKSLKAQG